METNENAPGDSSRRQFIKKSTLAAAAVAASTNIFKTPVYGQNTAPSANVAGANNRLVVGYIGVGVQGMAHVGTQKAAAAQNNIVQAAVCDLSTQRINDAAAAIGGGCKTFKSYEELLAQKDIDAVTIATTDHWHAKTTLAALEANKHVYIEKPMTRFLGEAFQVYDKVKATGKILQVGSQGCTAAAWHKAADLIKAGQIGPVVWAQGYYCRNNPKGEWNTEPYVPKPWCQPPDLDWDKWQEPAHDKRPFDPDSYFRWRKYYPYGCGPLGDLVPHRLLPLMVATASARFAGQDVSAEQAAIPEFPIRVVCVGTKNVHTDKNTPGTRERDCPEHLELLAEFPSGLTIQVVSSTVAARSPGFVIYGNHATLEIGTSGERIDLKPEKEFADEVDLATFDGLTPSEDIGEHEKNWFDSIRANKQPNAGIELGVRAQTVISLAEMSNRLKVACLFDEKTRTVSTADGKTLQPFDHGNCSPS